MAVVVVAAVVLAAPLMWRGLRAVLADAERTREAVVSSPWNELMTGEADSQLAVRARVGAVVSTGDEMLVELRPDLARAANGSEDMWLLGPANVAAIVALSRWHDLGAVVTIRGGPERFLLFTPQARVSFTGRAPTA
jgi:hypothetical protein